MTRLPLVILAATPTLVVFQTAPYGAVTATVMVWYVTWVCDMCGTEVTDPKETGE